MKALTTIVIILIIIIGGYFLLQDTDKTEDQNGLQIGIPALDTDLSEVDEMIVLSEEIVIEEESEIQLQPQPDPDPDPESEPDPHPDPDPDPDPDPESEPDPRKINVSGNDFSFSPSLLTFQAGERVKITFENVGVVPHNLVIEGTSIATKTIPKGKSDVIEFTAPSSGTYTIFCSVAGHRELGMVGVLTVE